VKFYKLLQQATVIHWLSPRAGVITASNAPILSTFLLVFVGKIKKITIQATKPDLFL